MRWVLGSLQRPLVLVIIGLAMMLPWLLGVNEPLSARLVLCALRMAGFSGASMESATVLTVGTAHYQVEFICTPVLLAWCGIVLLWFAGQKPWQYFLTCVAFVALSVVVITACLGASIGLHQHGAAWTWAHFPITAIGYAGCLLGCLLFAEARQRRHREARGAC
jgi:hypothetical protein